MEKIIPSGVIIENIQPNDYIFGASDIDNEIKVESGDWTPYLPTNEKQRQGFESMCCTNFSSTSAIEMLLNRSIKLKMVSVSNLNWLFDKGYMDDQGNVNFSDRFDAIVSGTNPSWGNSLKAPAEAKRKYGLIPEKMLPWTNNAQNYFNPLSITSEMYAMGKEFLTRFKINYETVYSKDFNKALKVSPIAIAVHAWNGATNGIYYKTDKKINHAITLIKPMDIWEIMDSYIPFIKRLANNYIFLSYGFRYIITELVAEDNTMVELVRKKGKKEVFLSVGGKRYWIKDAEDFNVLKDNQPITEISWKNIKEVDKFTTKYDGRIIGQVNLVDALKNLFGKVK